MDSTTGVWTITGMGLALISNGRVRGGGNGTSPVAGQPWTVLEVRVRVGERGGWPHFQWLKVLAQ